MTAASILTVIRSVMLVLLLARRSASTFFNNSLGIQATPLNISKQFTLSFRTCEGGTLLRQSDRNGFFELEIVPGSMDYKTNTFTESSLALRWRTSASSNIEVLNVGKELDQNKPYRVVFAQKTIGQNATLSVSLDTVYSVQVPDSINNVGGVNLTLGEGFVGCITFGDMFGLGTGMSSNCPLESGNRCPRKACPDGFKGYYCQNNTDDCASSPCHHASTCIDLIAGYNCSCGPAWFGRNCDQLKNETLCDKKPCLNNGICQPVSNFNNYTCTCPTPYTGRNCDAILNPCGSMPCQNNASCTNIKHVDFHCDCPKGFAGKHCEKDIDDCASADCGHGQCIDGIASYKCSCNGSGFTGDDCKQDINECDANPCKYNSSCSNYAGGYLCTCVGDYKGKNCDIQIDDCSPNPCKNGGNCTDLVRDFACHCAAGYSGRTCERKLDDCNIPSIGCTSCDVSPCIHGNCNCTCTLSEMFYNCTCKEGYTGVNCSQDINECVIYSDICGDNGTCINVDGSFRCDCSPGFAGRFCNETVGPCNPSPCENGVCVIVNITVASNGNNSSQIMETYNCSCHKGWRGVNCTDDIDECEEKIDTCNKSISTCINTEGDFQCSCHNGYETIGGSNKVCKDINECKSTPCQNGGHCQNKEGSFGCFCAHGFTGSVCQTNIDDCFNQTTRLPQCKHGSCKDGKADFTCNCFAGWMGKRCDKDVNECELGYCRNNATCQNSEGNYTCTCQAGYTDRNCSTDIDDCVGSPCLHNGTCMDRVNNYDCMCHPAYEGESCEIDIDWCDPSRNNGSRPCDYGTCKDGLLNYTCFCFDGFSGANCSVDIDECVETPCNNSGICVQKSNSTAVKAHFGDELVFPKNESGGYLCSCQPGYNGTNCENDIDECALHKACNDTGTQNCVDAINNYTCNCNRGFQGRNCSEDIDECSTSPCQNNGTCMNLIGLYKCICGANHTGMNCENLIDPCTALQPCKNGATCHVISDLNFTCACAEGFAGRLCTDRTTLGFDGTASMTVTVPESAFSNISFSFQTIFSKGILVSQSGAWTLFLDAGKLGLMCVGSSSCEIGKTGMFTNSDWHRVEVLYNGTFVNASTPTDNCTVACGSSRTRREVTPESKLVIGADAGDSDGAKFVGSIRDFSLNDITYYPGVEGVTSSGELAPGFVRQNVCLPNPCENGWCEDLWTRHFCHCDEGYVTSTNCSTEVKSGTFGTISELNNGYTFNKTSNKSYASYLVSSTFESLNFTVRTRSISSVIIQLQFNNSEFLSIETDSGGHLQLRNKDGYVNVGGLHKINDAIERHVHVNLAAVHVNGTSFDVTLTPFLVRIVFVGGLPETGDEGSSAHEQFRGCIRDVRLNEQQLLFFNQTKDGLNSTQVNIAEGCHGEKVCLTVTNSTSCSGRGNCTDLWNDFNCTCPFPYGGDTCELYGCDWMNPCPGNGTCVNLRNTSEYECINEVTFNESQSSAYFTNSTPLADISVVTAQFRTRQNNTVILSTVYNTTYLEIVLQDGRVWVRYNLAENMTGIVDTELYVSDGNWHQLEIESTLSQTNFKISTMKAEQDKFTFLEDQSISKNISLLNPSFTKLLSMAGVRIGSSPNNSTHEYLLGCLREIRLGKNLLTFHENSSADSRSEFSLAKSAFGSSRLSNVRIGCHNNSVCTGSVCGNGRCVENWNDFYCACPAGYHGDRCEFNPCTSSPCVNGSCTVEGSSFECACEDDFVGDRCNETCTPNFCKNGGKCLVSNGKLTCTCESDWTGQFCDSAVARDDNDDDDDLPLIIGLSVAGGVLLLLIIVVLFVCTRQNSSTFGTYSPSGEEKVGSRVEMSPVLNVPPPEKLI